MMFTPLKSIASLSLTLLTLAALGGCGPKPADTNKSGTTAPMTSPSGTSGGAMTPTAPASAASR